MERIARVKIYCKEEQIEKWIEEDFKSDWANHLEEMEDVTY